MDTSSKNLEKWLSEITRIVTQHLGDLDTEEFDEAITIKHPDLDVEYKSNVYLQLSDKEKEFCRLALRENLKACLSKLEAPTITWIDLSELLTELTAFDNKVADGENIYNLTRENLEHTLYIKSDRVFREIMRSFEKTFFKLLIEKGDFPTHDLFALSDDDLIFRGELVLRSKGSLEIVKFLQMLKKRLDDYRAKYEDLHYLKLDTTAKIVQRDMRSIGRWIDNSLMIATPTIEFLSKAQLEVLRNEIVRIATTTQLDFSNNLIERFDLMVRLKSVTLAKLDFKPFQSVEKITSDSQPAVVIRYLIFGIQSLNPKYKQHHELKNLKIWISTLFNDIPGFSYDNVRKALERNKLMYNNTRP